MCNPRFQELIKEKVSTEPNILYKHSMLIIEAFQTGVKLFVVFNMNCLPYVIKFQLFLIFLGQIYDEKNFTINLLDGILITSQKSEFLLDFRLRHLCSHI